MNIVILSGGSGNDAIVRGLINHGYMNSINVITNLYDNGKSTGVCRSVTDTLGVSDVRKNHFRAFKNYYSSHCLDSNLVELYSGRYDMGDDPESFCINKLESLNFPDLIEYVKRYFKNPTALNYSYNDFSIINIVYAQMYKELGYEVTNSYFTKLLHLNDFVHCNSFDNAYIYAYNESGECIGGEEDIVEYKNSNSLITNIKYLDSKGNDICQTLNEKAIKLVEEADLIIISTGTFWSSLYPTLEYGDFYKYVNKSNAKKVWFINTEEDKDSYGVSSNKFIEYMNNLGLDLSDFTIVENIDAKVSLRELNDDYDITYAHLGNNNGKNDSEAVYDVLNSIF